MANTTDEKARAEFEKKLQDKAAAQKKLLDAIEEAKKQ